MNNITRERVKELLEYDPDTGIFRWREGATTGPIRADRIAGTINSWGYHVIAINDRQYRAHRLAWLLFYGEWPDGPMDHINQNPSDNRIANIRKASPQENQRNKHRQVNNTSGHTGVVFHSADECWIARIVVDRKAIHLGRFKNKDDAIKARKKAEREHGFHKNHGRSRESINV